MEDIRVNRVEVIDHTLSGAGRAYCKYGNLNLEFSVQDDGQTLKIFITDKYGDD